YRSGLDQAVVGLEQNDYSGGYKRNRQHIIGVADPGRRRKYPLFETDAMVLGGFQPAFGPVVVHRQESQAQKKQRYAARTRQPTEQGDTDKAQHGQRIKKDDFTVALQILHVLAISITEWIFARF